MAAAEYDIEVEQGVPLTFQVQYKNPDGTPKNLTSWVVVGQVKNKISDCNSLGDLVIDIIDPTEGIFTVTVPPALTNSLKVKGNNFKDKTLLVYDIKAWPVGDTSDIRRLLNGSVKVSPEVTKVVL